MNRKMRWAVAAVLGYAIGAGVWLSPAGSAPPVAYPKADTNWALDPQTRAQDWRQDIDFLVEELPRKHRNVFFKCSRADFLSAAAALREAVGTLSDPEVVVGLMKLAAMIGDSHTGIQVGGLKPAFHSFPLSVYQFSDGPVIVGARESQRELIGRRLVRFGEAPIAEAFQRVSVAAAYENDATFKSNAPRLLAAAEVAHAVGLIPSADKALVTVCDALGVESTVDTTPLDPGEKLAVPTQDESQLPLSRQKRALRNWWEAVPGKKAVYLRYNACADEPGQAVAALAFAVLKAIDAQETERVVIDLRANGGGNSALLWPLIIGLKTRPALNRKGGVIVLIGRHTFSSAAMNASELKSAVAATLIGEPTGQKPNHYGEVRWLVLPRSQIVVQYSTKYFQTEKGDRPSIEPDVPVEFSSADYFALRDRVLEAALEFRAE